MAAAYAALVSFTHLIDQIRSRHARCPLFHNAQLDEIESLYKVAMFLQGFLEGYDYGRGHEIDGLESRIANTSIALEDIIHSYLGAQPLAEKLKDGKTNQVEFTSYPRTKFDRFCQGLQKSKEAMCSIGKEAEVIMEKIKLKKENPVSSPKLAPNVGKETMVGFADELLQMIDKLTRQDAHSLKVISITGMGGIGKTTLAKSVYDNPSIVKHFSHRAYYTVSQECNVKEMLLSLLRETGVSISKIEQESSLNHEIGQRLYQNLCDRRYLIILDDMWSIKVWKELQIYLPKNRNGSRIVITTRLSEIAKKFRSSDDELNQLELKVLNEKKSWSLLCSKVFDGKDCPPELEEVGKNIARDCKGLPLSISVVGGLLAKSRMTVTDWDYYAENISKTLTSDGDEHCLNLLSLSYNYLPIHLKPCFLYMGVYPEDHHVCVSQLIKVWVTEGFMKPIKTKSLEAAAKEYLQDLVERHLISVELWGSTGEMKTCSIHDLLRNLCFREAQKERFLYVSSVDSPTLSIYSGSRVVLQESFSRRREYTLFSNSSGSSFIGSLKLMRVLNMKRIDIDTGKIILRLVNSGHLKFIPEGITTLDIWKLPELKHVMVDRILLPNPQSGEGHEFLLENLQTIMNIHNFKCAEDVIKKVPNIRKLGIVYSDIHLETDQGMAYYSLQNLSSLLNLHSLACKSPKNEDFLMNVVLPHSLRKLTLECDITTWEDVGAKIATLPLLEKLTLETFNSGESWIMSDVEFKSLKFFKIKCNLGLVQWEAEDSNFPALERLILISMDELQEIPSDMGYMSTLRSIELVSCSDSIVASANDILEKQHGFGNDTFQLIVKAGSL